MALILAIAADSLNQIENLRRSILSLVGTSKAGQHEFKQRLKTELTSK